MKHAIATLTSIGDYVTGRENIPAQENEIQENKGSLNVEEPDIRIFPLFRSLSHETRKRILRLRELQTEYACLQQAHHEDVHFLSMKYEKLFAVLREKRRQIVTGVQQTSNLENPVGKTDVRIISNQRHLKNTSGIPDFWLTVFLNSRFLSCLIDPDDKPVLKHLQDVTLINVPDSWDFVLEFHFKNNDYFTNTILTKEYQVAQMTNPEDPYGLKNGTVCGCKGCLINWKNGKCVTHHITKQKSNGVSTFERVRKKSFFNFFDPPTNCGDEEPDDYLNDVLKDDYLIGLYMKHKIVPKAVLYYIKETDYELDGSEAGYSAPFRNSCVIV